MRLVLPVWNVPLPHALQQASGKHSRRKEEERQYLLQQQRIKRGDPAAQHAPPPVSRDSILSPDYFLPEQHDNALDRFLYWVRLLMVVVWFGILAAAAIYKLATSPLYDYVCHLTNWAWTAQLVFYSLDLLSYVDRTGKFSFAIVSQLFWLMNGLDWMVFTLMFAVLDNNPMLFVQIAEQGDIPLGIVMNGDRLFHIVPSLINFAYLLLNRKVISRCVEIFVGKQAPLASKIYYSVYATFFSPMLPPLIYLCMFNPQLVYGITTSNIILILVGLIGLVLFNVLPFICFAVKAYM